MERTESITEWKTKEKNVMARKAKVNYWASRGGFGCWHDGEQKLLAKGPDDRPDGPTFQAACDAFVRLQFGEQYFLTLAELFEKYQGRAGNQWAEDTIDRAREKFELFRRTLGDTRVNHITPAFFPEWLQRTKTTHGWSDGTLRSAIGLLKGCFAWGLQQGHVQSNPMLSIRLPQMPSRGMESVLSPEDLNTVIKSARPTFRDLVLTFADTGARPKELRIVEKKHFSRRDNAFVLPASHRTSGDTHKCGRFGKDRVIYLSPCSMPVVERLMFEFPSGPLFRSPAVKRKGKHKGERWGYTRKGLVSAMIALKEKAGILQLSAYSFRHTYAVRWLEASKPIATLAELLGTSIAMIERHYGHLAQQHDYLRRMAEDGSPLAALAGTR